MAARIMYYDVIMIKKKSLFLILYLCFGLLSLCVILLYFDIGLFIFAVAGESLKRTLSCGVRDKMEKAMMFLVQKSSL